MQGLGAPGRSIWGTTMGAPNNTTCWVPAYGEPDGRMSSASKVAKYIPANPNPQRLWRLTVPDAIANEKGYYGASNKWNGIPAKFSSFAFHENRFYTATTVFDPREASFDDLKHSLTKTHGQPKTSGPKTVTWVLGQTNVALYKGESFHGVVYSHRPGFAKVAKIKNYPMVDPPKTSSAKKKK